MPMIEEKHVDVVIAKLGDAMERYQALMFKPVGTVEAAGWPTREHLRMPPDGNREWKPLKAGDVWGGEWENLWIKGSFTVDEALAGQPLFLQAATGAVEAMLWVDGMPVGLYNENAGAAYYSLGSHHTLRITGGAAAGSVLNLALEAYAGHFCAGCMPADRETRRPEDFLRTYRGLTVCTRREDVLAFIMDLRTLMQLAECLPETSFRRAKVRAALVEVSRTLVHMPAEREEEAWRDSLARARAIMAEPLSRKNGPSAPYAALVGHSHMDTAWLWPVDETIRKCARTYALALSMMEQYPEYIFIQSSALHAYWMEKQYPMLFQRMQEKVKEGRWEPNGGVWVECDCNVTGGEAMVRQFLRGQRYTRQAFGYTSDTFWLPDTFGYSAAIPQILKGVGIRYFCTTKLSWNDTTAFPMDTFLWKGLDGSAVMAHFNTTHSWPDAKHLITSLEGGSGSKNFVAHKQVNDSRLVAYGFGDGGGGPMFEMLEASRRVQDLEGCPRSYHSTVSDYLHRLEAEADLPTYTGELYLQLHRGTLTQRHEVKRNNRKGEIALRSLEMAQVWAMLAGKAVRAADIQPLWDTLLMNQFHDILPGTCITEVYERAIPEMRRMIEEAEEKTQALLQGGGAGFTLVNPLSWERNDTQYLDVPGYAQDRVSQRVDRLCGGEALAVAPVIPAMGAASIALTDTPCDAPSPFAYDGRCLTTPYAEIIFDESGSMASFIDRANGRQLVREAPLNRFYMGEDVPALWDCWDINADTLDMLVPQERLLERQVVSDGPLQLRIRSHYAIGPRSELWQDMVFHAQSPRIDFETRVDWQDKHHLLKVGFDLDILADRIRNEVQFGHLERPTTRNDSREQAMFEVCNHKWSDLSENRYGAALANDCKYGISCEGGHMMLTLHKGGTHPDECGDVGVHAFTYSFLPHMGGFAAETVIRPAYELNMPALVAAGAADMPQLAQVDAPNVIVEAVKLAEDDEGALIYRLYEAERSAVTATLTLPGKPLRAELTNLLEEPEAPLELEGNQIRLGFRAFEIKTVKVYYR